jgi:hypothetical protein
VTLPTFLIIGAAKSGTTSLALYLEAHPEVYVASRKEVRFFDRHWAEGVPWYEEHFRAAGDARVVGEGSPSYFHDPQVPARVAETLPDVRLVALLRDPVARALSAYHFAVGLGREQRDLQTALEDELAGRDSGSFVPRYLETGRYAEHLERWHRLVPPERLHVELFEELRDSPGPVFSRICAFLGVDPEVQPTNLGRVYHASYTFRWDWWRRAMQRYRLWDRLPLPVAYRISALNRIERPYAPPLPATRTWLEDYYAEPNARLAQLLERPLPWVGDG